MSREKILIIEDDRDISQMLHLYLELEGYEVVTSYRGRDGLAQVHQSNPDMILLDVNLPDMSGWQVCRQIKDITPAPVIFITGLDEIDDITRGLEIGASDYVVKPFDGKILAARIRAHLRQTPHLDSVTTSGMIVTKPIFGAPPEESRYNSDIFVLMPFRQDMLPVYSDLIVPLTKSLNLVAKRGDNFFSEYSIVKDIWGAIYGAKLIIADCSGRNPNVFYELGIAHTLGKKVIMITQAHEDIPFDLKHLRYLHYEFTFQGMRRLEQELKWAISSLMEKV